MVAEKCMVFALIMIIPLLCTILSIIIRIIIHVLNIIVAITTIKMKLKNIQPDWGDEIFFGWIGLAIGESQGGIPHIPLTGSTWVNTQPKKLVKKNHKIYGILKIRKKKKIMKTRKRIEQCSPLKREV